MTDEIRIRHIKAAYLDIFETPPQYKEDFERALPEWVFLGSIGQAGAFIHDGRILYIGGYLFRTPTVAEVWAYPSIYMKGHELLVIKHVKWWMWHLENFYKLTRIQTWGDGSEAGYRWLTFLGFEHEGMLNSYLPNGGALHMWGKVCKRAD